MMRVTVRQAKHTSRPFPHVQAKDRFTARNWRVEQEFTFGLKQVFTYRSYHWAIKNADRLARGQLIGSYGLRGFHIETS